jgi:hypothetical protein
VDLSILFKNERNKILNQRAKNAKKAMEKVEKEFQKAKKGEKLGKS